MMTTTARYIRHQAQEIRTVSHTTTTTTGGIPSTSGAASLEGHDVSKEPEAIHRLLGYCPQFDALFETLTGREHLRLYAAIKARHDHDCDSIQRVNNTCPLMNGRRSGFPLVNFLRLAAKEVGGSTVALLVIAHSLTRVAQGCDCFRRVAFIRHIFRLLQLLRRIP